MLISNVNSKDMAKTEDLKIHNLRELIHSPFHRIKKYQTFSWNFFVLPYENRRCHQISSEVYNND